METVFWICFSLLFWCYVAYPVGIIIWGALRPGSPLDSSASPTAKVAVIVAARNEAANISRRISNLLSQHYPADRLKVVVVCNGCTDNTQAVAERAGAESKRVQVLQSPSGHGKAGALNTGVAAAADADVVVFADARQQFAPDAVRHLVNALRDPSVGAVSGRLVIGRSAHSAVDGVRRYWQAETMLRLAESRTGSVVGATGAIYAVRRALCSAIPAGLILDDVYLPMHVVMLGYRVKLAPEALALDTPAHDQRTEYQRKRRTMLGNLQLVRLQPKLLIPGLNPLWLRLISHKLLRVLSPLFFLGMLVAAASSSAPVYTWIFRAELTLYLLGAIGVAWPISALSLPAAFVMIHAAAGSAMLRFKQDAGLVWTQPPPEAEHSLPRMNLGSNRCRAG